MTISKNDLVLIRKVLSTNYWMSTRYGDCYTVGITNTGLEARPDNGSCSLDRQFGGRSGIGRARVASTTKHVQEQPTRYVLLPCGGTS